MHIDFSELAISPNESRAARNFLGMSQAQAATKFSLSVNKLKRFETGTYVPDTKFVQELRELYEGEGFNFNDEKTPGAKARAMGDVFNSGVLGDLAGSIEEPDGFPAVELGKLPRPQKANLQFMRISPVLENDQIDRVFSCIEDNETAIVEGSETPIVTGFLESSPSAQSQALAISMLRRLAENGLLYARLMGRDLLPAGAPLEVEAPRRGLLFSSSSAPVSGNWKTVGELMQTAMTDVQLAFVDGDKPAQARRKARIEPKEVLQALVG
jgi:transcriptional regulator with XRE-family HTH domain